MHSKTEELKKLLKKQKTIQEKLVILKNAYEGESCYIITCGPSLNELDHSILRQKLKDKLVFSIKQAYDLFGDITDFHILNNANVKKYIYPNKDTIVVKGKLPKAPVDFCSSDLDLRIKPFKKDPLEESIANLGDFSPFSLDKTLDRPVGPGIMYELVFYIAEFLGVKEIITFGWDIASKKTKQNEHFYEENQKIGKKMIKKLSWVSGYCNSRIPLISALINFTLHHLNFKYNPGDMLPKEADLTSVGSIFLNQWLKSQGINLKICSNLSLVDKSINRIDFSHI